MLILLIVKFKTLNKKCNRKISFYLLNYKVFIKRILKKVKQGKQNLKFQKTIKIWIIWKLCYKVEFKKIYFMMIKHKLKMMNKWKIVSFKFLILKELNNWLDKCFKRR